MLCIDCYEYYNAGSFSFVSQVWYFGGLGLFVSFTFLFPPKWKSVSLVGRKMSVVVVIFMNHL